MNASASQSPTATPARPHLIQVGRKCILTQISGKQVEANVFTMSLGGETIELLPFRNWGQLDVHKWRVRGKLPATPAGLEITPDHVKVAGEVVSLNAPEACSTLQRLLNEWLALEQGTLELARKKNNPKPSPMASGLTTAAEEQPLHFRVELDHEGQVHVRCAHGKTCLAEIGLTVLGWNSLVSQGLMRKPANLKVGALHDWVELDGEFYSFEKGRNDSERLEKVLNEKYLSSAALGQGKDVVVFTNAASSTGFDIQFAVTVGGVPDRRRRALNEETLELLQDSQRCGVLSKGLVIKMTRPTLIFKQKTPDGGEKYLDRCAENLVSVFADDGSQKTIDLSQPVNYLHLSAMDLTAIFNHPTINQHSKVTPSSQPTANGPVRVPAAPLQAPVPPPEPSPPKVIAPVLDVKAAPAATSPPAAVSPPVPEVAQGQSSMVAPGPNEWLEPILAMPQIRFHWFARLIYGQLAERFGNSQQGKFGPVDCWYICIGEKKDIEEFEFHGIFLTDKGSLGFLNHGHMARFYKGVAFLGGQENALEGIDVNLAGVGLDSHQRVVFIVSEDFLTKFGVSEQTVAEELERLKMYEAIVLSSRQALESREAIQVVWTVPAEQENPDDPDALEGTPLAPLEVTQ